MSVGWVALAASVVGTAASITAGKKTAKAQKEAAQEAAYIEGAAPSIPVANELAIAYLSWAKDRRHACLSVSSCF